MYFVLYLISPLFALLLSFHNIKSKQFYFVFLLMAIYMGLVLNVDSGGDMSRYLDYPSIWKGKDWSMIFLERDYVFPILSKLFSYITTDRHCFGSFIIVIYAALYLQSFKIVTEFVLNQSSIWYYISTFAIFLILPYSRVFAMRFALASSLYLWCILEIIVKKNKRFYWIIMLVPLMHYSFLIMVLLPFLHLLLKKRLLLCMILFGASFVLNTPRVAYFINDFAVSYLPQGTSDAVDSYASEEGLEYMNNRDADGARYGNTRRAILGSIQEGKTYVIMFAMVLILIFSYKEIKKDKFLVELFTMMLLFFTMSNIASSASRGDRFLNVGCALTVFVLYRMSHHEVMELNLKQLVSKNINRVILSIIFLTAIIYGIMYNYAMRWDYDYTLLCFGNPVLAILKILGVLNY